MHEVRIGTTVRLPCTLRAGWVALVNIAERRAKPGEVGCSHNGTLKGAIRATNIELETTLAGSRPFRSSSAAISPMPAG